MRERNIDILELKCSLKMLKLKHSQLEKSSEEFNMTVLRRISVTLGPHRGHRGGKKKKEKLQTIKN